MIPFSKSPAQCLLPSKVSLFVIARPSISVPVDVLPDDRELARVKAAAATPTTNQHTVVTEHETLAEVEA